jgi:hypothetical protein
VRAKVGSSSGYGRAMSEFWSSGDIVARDELLGFQPDEVTSRTAADGVWLQTPVYVVEDTAEHLVTYTARGARFRFPSGPWPTSTGRHPWSDRRYTTELVTWIRAYGNDLTSRLRSDGPWWDRSWAQWTPPDDWIDPELPPD